MTRDLHIWDSKGWRKGVAILLAAYCLLAWVLPIAVMAFFSELPYLQERRFLDRLVLSAAATAALLAAMVVFFRERFLIYRASTPWHTAKNGMFFLLGLAMFTAAAAHWSGNTFGALAKLMPGSEYWAQFTVSEVDEYRGSRRWSSVFLALKPKEGKGEVYLTLSRRLFDYPAIQVGDELFVSGKQNMAGVYVDRFRLRRGQREFLVD